jgi:hypothetical protein
VADILDELRDYIPGMPVGWLLDEAKGEIEALRAEIERLREALEQIRDRKDYQLPSSQFIATIALAQEKPNAE